MKRFDFISGNEGKKIMILLNLFIKLSKQKAIQLFHLSIVY
jgi:hypothetical protein